MAQPNILIIQTDQHRWDCLGVTGNPDIRTPNVDAIANDGSTFEQSFCPYPVCTPSRYSFLTGLWVHQHLGWTNHCTIPNGMATFPRILRSAGYRTKAVGKMHLTPTYLDVGFDEMVLAEQNGPGRYEDDYHRYLREEGLCDAVDLVDQEREYRSRAAGRYWDTFGSLVSDLDEAHHSSTWIGDRAVETLDAWEGDGNLLMASFIKPHHPFDPPAPWDEMYDPAGLTLLPGWAERVDPEDVLFSKGYFPHSALDERKLRRVMAHYYGSISHIDHHVGRMIDSLRARGLYDKTLIVFNSDHGEYLGSHHMKGKGNRMYEPLVRVPLIVKWPGQTREGVRRDDLVNTIDLAPTLLNAAGCEVPDVMPGFDLRKETPREVMFAESGRGFEYMARSRTHKLLMCEDSEFDRLYDLENDPTERTNVFREKAHAEVRDELRDELMRWALFDARTVAHLDEHAPVVAGRPDPDPRGKEWQSMYDYFAGKMEEAFEAGL
jgi:arylsulfatase A-like enzyme